MTKDWCYKVREGWDRCKHAMRCEGEFNQSSPCIHSAHTGSLYPAEGGHMYIRTATKPLTAVDHTKQYVNTLKTVKTVVMKVIRYGTC